MYSNMLTCFKKKSIDQSSVGFHINASYWRRFLSLSNRMRYTQTELDFWSYFKLMHHEAPVRLLSGVGQFMAGLKGEPGSQSPDELKITIPIPSLRVRKDHGASSANFKVSPGFTEDSFQILKECNFKTVNLGFDEKKLADGCRLVKTTDEVSGLTTFSSLGDIDYFFPEINSVKDNYMSNLNHHYNLSLSDMKIEGTPYLIQLLDNLTLVENTLLRTVKKLKDSGKTDTVVLPREVARLVGVQSSIRDIISLQNAEEFDELKFKTVINKATESLLRPATHILVVMANNVYGLKKGSHSTSIPLLWVRSGKGVQVKREYRFLVNKVKKKLASLDIACVCLSGDTANHGILLNLNSGEPNNWIGLKRSLYIECRKKTVKVLKREIKQFENTPAPSLDGEFTKIQSLIFPELGDFCDFQIEKIIGESTLKEYQHDQVNRHSGNIISRVRSRRLNTENEKKREKLELVETLASYLIKDKLKSFNSQSAFKCPLVLPYQEFEESSPIELCGLLDKTLVGGKLGKQFSDKLIFQQISKILN